MSYNDMVKVIDVLEAGARKGELGYIDMSGVIGGAKTITAESYREILDTVEELEAKQKGVSGIKQAAKQVHEPEEHRAAAEGARAERPAKRERMEEEIKAVAGRMPEAKPRFGELRIKMESAKGLVLPSLQISDQIHELERIIAALKENALDEGQIRIARMEVSGLNKHVLGLKKELKREGKGLDQLGHSLWDMRDQRLGEAAALLDSYRKSD